VCAGPTKLTGLHAKPIGPTENDRAAAAIDPPCRDDRARQFTASSGGQTGRHHILVRVIAKRNARRQDTDADMDAFRARATFFARSAVSLSGRMLATEKPRIVSVGFMGPSCRTG